MAIRKHALGWHRGGLSDFEFRLVIEGRPFVLKNSKKVIIRAVRLSREPYSRRCPRCSAPLSISPTVIPSTAAEAYKADATLQLRRQWSQQFGNAIPPDIEINAAIVTYRADRRRADASNLYQMPEDAMQAAGVLTDDYQIRSHNGSSREYDKDNPRVEITLTPYRTRGDDE